MACTIDISNLRNITKLQFEMPDPGVWLLTAGNGAGKTSLLGCIRRIGQSYAFQLHFPSSLKSLRLDNNAGGKVTYTINGESVEYAYRGERWTPRPRSNANLFGKLGYASVIYIGASAERITPRPEDFETNNIRKANTKIIEAANKIFETDKFTMLRTINLTPGVSNDAFVLALGNSNPHTYHSEKHFSLGELCVLKLLRTIQETKNNSLLIVDELEMALHPRAQIKLLKYLEDQAKAKSLTVIFSTHSVTLLKSIDRRKIIYLEKQNNGEIKPIVGCYPTYALGNIASNEETLPDIMLYVEDTFARDILTAFFEKFSNEKISDPTARPAIKIVPVGGFNEVISFLERNRSVLPDRVKQKAILDGDVKDETLKVLQGNKNYSQLSKFERLKNDIDYLPFTPEVGLLDHIKQNLAEFETRLRERFMDNQIRIGEILNDYKEGLNRADAKKTSNKLIKYLMMQTQKTEDMVREHVCGVFANTAWKKFSPKFMELFAPMLK